MPISDIAQVSIILQGAGLTQLGFGTPLILSPRPTWTERVRSYADLNALSGDFATTTPEYLAASAMFAQSPQPVKVKVGRCANVPTQVYTVTPTAAHSTVYKLLITGADGVDHLATWTSDSSATVAEQTAAAKTAIDALSLALTVVDGSTSVSVTANAADTFWSIRPFDYIQRSLLSVKQSHADPGLAADLAAIQAEDDDWYGFMHLYNSDACVQVIKTFAEANEKIFVAQLSDTQVTKTASTTDEAYVLKAASINRTVAVYHSNPREFIDAALLGNRLPVDPGSDTWAHKTLAGVTADDLTSTERGAVTGKNCNIYYTIAGRNVLEQGKCPSGEFADIIRGRDWQKSDMETAVAQLVLDAEKIPYTDAGFQQIGAEMSASLQRGVARGFVASYTVTVPTVASQSPTDKAARTARNFKFTATLAGAVHLAIIQGNLST